MISRYRKGPPPQENPEGREFALRGLLLRGRLKDSNFVLLKIPIEIHLFRRGRQGLYIDPARLSELPGLCDQDIGRLQQTGLVHPPASTPQLKERIDYAALRETYARMLAEEPFPSQFELARHLGASRVLVSRVSGINRKAR